jgi:hypothetical protein
MEALFLDQNKWIELACVRTGTVSSGPSYIAYAELHEAVERGRVVAPLTVAHILETSKRNDQASRAHVAEVQASLSKGFVFRSRKARLLIEIRNAVHSAFGEPRVQLEPNWAIVPGFMQAFEPFDTLVAMPAEVTRSRLINQHVDPKDQYLDYMLHQNDEYRRKAHARFSAESDALLARIEGRRALMNGSTIDLRWRAYAAQLFLDHQDYIAHMLDVIGHTVDEMKQLGAETIMKFVRNVPTLNVEAELAARLEAQTGPLKSNDIRDMQSFYTVIPYANQLVAEKCFISLARQAKLDVRYGTRLSARLEDIIGVYK